ncbi:aminotransferase class I/II-fold pyridoxal phosphate-dependent enzyme [Sphingobacterium sp. DK4209]|uniref:Aminotransferase class I/II-fold pyridoxal phosphate-dependent enzyme n=1 Tax=Sphingobacterium zhuxiongii TaxID=2662364 RepID=A0A5Q0QGM9_9SPHI|nr:MULTISPECIES: 8-amino-7-oxononanoate synthase [unclassified Sphingobacterium]MVZ66640.1 aminotransferase class I/II-fold pyridoxal phosphate-dependent enzyme [Sphingobacterium sp. DK4209]QGA26822.1 aminotransferase class I/II-fold pyridoxal phosphate-dependent enzyme [Sphingobacterium sp. dk4302]
MLGSWQAKLVNRIEDSTVRTLKMQRDCVDFSSNDYLGLARNPLFQGDLMSIVLKYPSALKGATGSRLISGNTRTQEEVETFLAQRYGVESALLMSSGYIANLSLVSSLALRGDTILVDELIHRSVHDGCQMSAATKWKFRHQDLNHLESLLKKARGQIWVLVESIYSMDGDYAPLADLIDLTEAYGANLIVDEAHAVGVYGNGLVYEQGLMSRVFATVITFGKAMGFHGAAVLASQELNDYLVNFASPIIYSTGNSDLMALSIQAAYQFIDKNPTLREQLQQRIMYFNSHLKRTDRKVLFSAIQPVIIPELNKLKSTAEELERAGLSVYPVMPPTVPVNTGRLRICLHTHNSFDEIDRLTTIIKEYL